MVIFRSIIHQQHSALERQKRRLSTIMMINKTNYERIERPEVVGQRLLALFVLLVGAACQTVSGFTTLPPRVIITQPRTSINTRPSFVVNTDLLVEGELSSLFSSTKDTEETAADITIPKNDDEISKLIESFSSPVLKQVYRKLLEHLSEFGNPNIPLGTSDGRQCETLRRLAIQQKLTPTEVEALDTIGFRWHSLEDVYYTAEFDKLFQRLLDYQAMIQKKIKERTEDANVSLFPPKKYAQDPELGAWVTGLRRVGRDGVTPEHLEALEKMNFAWVSQRACGSKFMQQYRALCERLEKSADSDGSSKEVWKDEAVQQWIKAQRDAASRNGLSETRQHYMETLLGKDWKTVDMDNL